MGIGVVFVEVIIHVFQLILYSLCGAGLSKVGAFDKAGEYRSALANLHCFIPLFEIVVFSQAANVLNSDSLGLLFFTFVISSFIAIFFAIIYSRVSKMDIRITRVFILLNAFGDVAFLPEVLTDAMCAVTGPLNGDAACSKIHGYSFYVLFLFNFALLLFGPFFMHSDKALAYNVMRQMIIVRHFYPKSAQDFLDDTNLSALDAKQIEGPVLVMQEQEKSPTDKASPQKGELEKNKNPDLFHTAAQLTLRNGALKETFNTNFEGKVPMTVLEDEELVLYSLALHMDREIYAKFQEHFDKLLEKIHPDVFDKLFKEVPNVEPTPKVDKAFLIHQATSRAIWGCIISIIFGTHSEAIDWLFISPENKKLFMGTIVGIQSLAIPLAVMIWGMELVRGFQFKGRNIRLMDLIALISIRLVILPSIGLGFVYGLSQNGIAALDNDRVLLHSMYANWCIPPGLLMLTLFVLSNYYAGEGALMMCYSTISSIIFSPLFTWAYTAVFNLSFPVGVRYRPG